MVAETSSKVIENSRSQDFTHPDDHKSPTYEMDPLPSSGSWLLSALPIELTSKLTVMKSTAKDDHTSSTFEIVSLPASGLTKDFALLAPALQCAFY